MHKGVVGPWQSIRLELAGKGRVVSSEGRSIRQNGPPLMSLLEVELGQKRTVWRQRDRLVLPQNLRMVRFEVSRQEFDFCPICLSESDLTVEHVPSQRLGGRPLVPTCKECNNKFGSKFENDLLRLSEERFALRFRGPGFKGERVVKDVVIRESDQGETMMTPWNGSWPDFIQILFDGGSGYEYRIEHSCECRGYVALLKNGYLAACAAAPQSVQKTKRWPVTELVRLQLLKWRDSDDDHMTMHPGFRKLKYGYNSDALVIEDPGIHGFLAVDRSTNSADVVLKMGWKLWIQWPLDAVSIRFQGGSVVIEGQGVN